jgi:hypothetical protein
MSETRALRDKLEELQTELRRTREHLEKLRAHQSRERESLGQELETARLEVSRLRSRLERLEAREGQPPRTVASAVRATPAIVERLGAVPTLLPAAGGRAPGPGKAVDKSDAQKLRDKLAQVQADLRQTKAELEKQRTQHVREQQSLQKDLEDTRTEAVRLHSRIEKAEALERGRAVALSAEPSDGRAPGVAVDTFVALAKAPASVEQALPVLSRLLRISPVDVRLRLMASTPSILARLPGLEAELLRDLLAAEGFPVVSAPVSQLVGALTPIRRFTLGEQSLVLEDAKGASSELPYPEVRLLVRGRRKSTVIEKSVEMEYGPTVSPDRFNTRQPKEEIIRHPRVENFLWVYSGSVRAAFTEATSFLSLGARQGLTKHEAMQNLLAELRQRAPRAVVDERLMGPSLSLPMVGPERSQEVLAGLMDQSIQASLWP